MKNLVLVFGILGFSLTGFAHAGDSCQKKIGPEIERTLHSVSRLAFPFLTDDIDHLVPAVIVPTKACLFAAEYIIAARSLETKAVLSGAIMGETIAQTSPINEPLLRLHELRNELARPCEQGQVPADYVKIIREKAGLMAKAVQDVAANCK